MEDRVYPSYINGAQNNSHKGFTHSYPLQQPESPQSPRRRRCRCCVCCCWVLLVLIVLLCIGAALVYFLMKPKAPKYNVQSATIAKFNLTSQSHLTADIKFVISASNPNKKVEFFFGNGTATASYEGADIGQGAIPAFHQAHQSAMLVTVEVQGRDIALHGSSASDLKKGLANKSNILLQLEAATHFKVKIGSLKSWGQKVKLSCDVTIAAPSKPGNVQIVSSSCKLKNP